ncbi:hypothetical protein NE237_031233 [Protea cynaroides]|uniref:Uncharacterized protein n=1 Tax=Protea cynaroides TaxID=273540 RepID=A0A9Q0L152_9MAGN|nr:hypothetical protein NE237_031233 [Protea cynaroides]
MGLTDVFNSVTEKVRRNSPSVPTSVRNACWGSYDLGRAAVFKIDNVVRVTGYEKVKAYIPGPETRQKISVCAFKIADSPLGKEGLKLIPGGGLAYETYKWAHSVEWFHSVEDDEKTKGMQAGNHKVDAVEHLKYEKKLKPASVTAQKPEDVLSDFMQNGFMGRAFLDTLFVPNVGTTKNHQKDDISKGY